MYRREDEPYPEEGYGRGGEGDHHHHRHHFGHHEEQPEGGSNPYGASVEHRPPPPSRHGYGDADPPGYGEGPYGRREPGPYDAPSAGGGSPYPPAPHSSGHGYGDAAYQTSPYAQPPTQHHRSMAEQGHARPRPIPGFAVKLHCKANPDFSLAVVPGQGPVMKHTDPDDDYQIWYKDETMSTRVKDETGASAFALINKATGQAMRHAPEDLKQCLLAEYEPNGYDESVWWTMSEDMGHGYRCIRLANKITRNLDVLRGDKKSGGVKEGSPVITFAWKKQDNQIWKMTPA